MARPLLAALFAAGLIAAVTLAQPPKDQPKKKAERIAVNDPEKLKDDADFAAQGEYAGISGPAKPMMSEVGAQVIARGGGKFEWRLLNGGLPGDGWDKKAARSGTGERKDGKLFLSLPENGKPVEMAVIEGGKLAVPPNAELKKIERKSPTLGAKPPAGAVVLFGGPEDVSKWAGGKVVELSDGKFLGVGTRSKQAFGAFKAHLEFRLPWMPNSTGQGRGNSGVYVQDRYEIQVLDSFGLKGENNECGGIYTQHKPLVNMCLPPMQWQTYDIEFTPAAFEAGKKVTNARLTVRHNGVKIHDNVELPKECPGGQPETEKPGPFQLQNHGDPVVYRNIWVVETK